MYLQGDRSGNRSYAVVDLQYQNTATIHRELKEGMRVGVSLMTCVTLSV